MNAKHFMQEEARAIVANQIKTVDEAKEFTRKKLEKFYDKEVIEEVVSEYVKIVRPGVVLIKNKNVGYMELWL